MSTHNEQLQYLTDLQTQHKQHLYNQQRMFAKSNGYQGDINALASNVHPLPEIFLTSVPNTEIGCTACRATGWLNIVHEGGEVTLEKCGMCGGSKHIMSAENNMRTDWKTWNNMQLKHRQDSGENVFANRRR